LKYTKYQRNILLSIITFSSFVRADTRIESQEILESMRGGEAIIFQNIMITGDLDFTELCYKISTLPEKEETIMEKVLGFFVEINIKENQEVQCDIEVPIEFMGYTFQDRVIGWINDEKNEVSYNAIFHNDIIFTNCNFKDAEFSQPVNLEGTLFNGNTDFKYTTIGGEEFVKYLLNAKID